MAIRSCKNSIILLLIYIQLSYSAALLRERFYSVVRFYGYTRDLHLLILVSHDSSTPRTRGWDSQPPLTPLRRPTEALERDIIYISKMSRKYRTSKDFNCKFLGRRKLFFFSLSLFKDVQLHNLQFFLLLIVATRGARAGGKIGGPVRALVNRGPCTCYLLPS